MIINHEEATELAEMQQDQSNLARCYLDMRKELAELREEVACLNEASRKDLPVFEVLARVDELEQLRADKIDLDCALKESISSRHKLCAQVESLEAELRAKAEVLAVGEIVAEDWGAPFPAKQLRVHFYSECPAVGTKIFAAPPAQAVSVPETSPGNIEILRFLTDVVTAAGLLHHGKTDKQLAARIAKCAYSIRSGMLAAAPSPDATGRHEQRLVDLLQEVAQGCLDHANESDNPIKGEWLHAECVIRNVLEEFNRG